MFLNRCNTPYTPYTHKDKVHEQDKRQNITLEKIARPDGPGG